MLSRRSLFAIGGAGLLLNGCAQVAPDGGAPRTSRSLPSASRNRYMPRSGKFSSSARNSPRRIPDGARVTVDGVRGVVTVEGLP